MLDGLAFLPETELLAGLAYLRGVRLMRVRRIPSIFPPVMWNVRDAITGAERTNNCCERCNHNFASSVGQQHPSLWHLLQCMQQWLTSSPMLVASCRLSDFGVTHSSISSVFRSLFCSIGTAWRPPCNALGQWHCIRRAIWHVHLRH